MLSLLFLCLTVLAQEMPEYGTERWVKAAELVIDDCSQDRVYVNAQVVGPSGPLEGIKTFGYTVVAIDPVTRKVLEAPMGWQQVYDFRNADYDKFVFSCWPNQTMGAQGDAECTQRSLTTVHSFAVPCTIVPKVPEDPRDARPCPMRGQFYLQKCTQLAKCPLLVTLYYDSVDTYAHPLAVLMNDKVLQEDGTLKIVPHENRLFLTPAGEVTDCPYVPPVPPVPENSWEVFGITLGNALGIPLVILICLLCWCR
mmetsp:Transcript_136979/g.238117  ORF Transcript_136979/g.238117 Transcript_136979/m.238117 type:complete len:254 (-) Transcript_136979:68-829(-)